MGLQRVGQDGVTFTFTYESTAMIIEEMGKDSQMLGHRQGLALGHWVKMKWKNQNRGVIFFF